MATKNYPFPDKEIKDYHCSGCDVYYRTDYDYGYPPACPHCWKTVDVKQLYNCDDCEDTGEVDADESDGEGHIQRGVGTQICHCRVDDSGE